MHYFKLEPTPDRVKLIVGEICGPIMENLWLFCVVEGPFG